MAPEPAGPPVVAVTGLVKHLRGGVRAVDGLDLVVQPGQVMGLAGPNGAGKSVTLKVLLGLVRPDAGRVELFGEPVRPGAPVLARVGALVDGPGFVPHLTGLANLELAARLTPGGDRAALAEALELAGLGEAVHRRYDTYSHGMRYRLGLAQALLGRPDLVLLDEPTTGLDPAHVLEVRAAIRAVHRRGATVVLSSHQLAEVEQVCTHAVVVQAGRAVAQGSVEELVGPASTVRFEVDDPARAAEVLGTASGVRSATAGGPDGPEGPGWVVAEGSDLRPAGLVSALADAGVVVGAFRRGRSLEQAYLDVLGPEGPAPTRAG
jgi:ABC-2 type transport system ATP-binding protein